MPKSGLGPHNTLVLFLGESGLVGFSLFLASALLWCWSVARNLDSRWRTFYVGSAVVMLTVMFSGHGWLIDRGCNVMFGLCLGLLASESNALVRCRPANRVPASTTFNRPVRANPDTFGTGKRAFDRVRIRSRPTSH